MEVRPFADADRARIERMMDDFGDEIAAMDPHGRCIREPGYGAEFTRQMLEAASGPDGIVLVAEDGGEISGFASGRVQARDERERLEVIEFRSGIVLSCTLLLRGDAGASGTPCSPGWRSTSERRAVRRLGSRSSHRTQARGSSMASAGTRRARHLALQASLSHRLGRMYRSAP